MENYTDKKHKDNSVFGMTTRRVRDIMNFDAPPKKEVPHLPGRHARSTFDASATQRDYETQHESQ